jgi:hypothetical protein
VKLKAEIMKKLMLTSIMLIVLGTISASAQGFYYSRPRPQPQRRYYPQQRYNNDYNDNSIDCRYKGFLEVGFGGGVGDYRANELDILTTHGMQIGNSVFVGLGTGVNVLFTQNDNNNFYNSSSYNGNYNTTAAMIPLYADLRLKMGGGRTVPFLDLKLGTTYLVNSGDVYINDRYLDSGASLYFSPSIGVHMDLLGTAGFNVALTYSLISQNTRDYYYDDGYYDGERLSLNNLGARISVEW